MTLSKNIIIAISVSVALHLFIVLILAVFSTPQPNQKIELSKHNKSIISSYTVDNAVYEKELLRTQEFETKQKQSKLNYQTQIRQLKQQKVQAETLYNKLNQRIQNQENSLKKTKMEVVKIEKQKNNQKKIIQEQERILSLKETERKKLERTLTQKEKALSEKNKMLQEKEKQEQLLRNQLKKKQSLKKNIDTQIGRKQKILQEQQKLYQDLQHSLSTTQKNQLQAIQANYIATISAKVRNNWRQPINTQKKWNCNLLVAQNNNGVILEVNVKQCNTTNQAFIHSVERAVWASSPLPLPESSSVFDTKILFNFKATTL